jgi:DHA1 family bicyclomycin/chloramphenicol resistance-like MFS transporter
MGAATLFFVALRLPETLRDKNSRATSPGPLLATWGRIARHPTFVAWTLLVSFIYGGLFTVLAGSAFVYIDVLGLSAQAYGLAMASASASYLADTFVCRRWVARLGMAGAVRRGAVFFAAASGLKSTSQHVSGCSVPRAADTGCARASWSRGSGPHCTGKPGGGRYE